MAIGDTRFYKTNTGDYQALEETGNDSGLTRGGYQDFGNGDTGYNNYVNSIKSDMDYYKSIAPLYTGTSLLLKREDGSNYGEQHYTGPNPNEQLTLLQKKYDEAQARQGVFASGYNSGAQVINGNYTGKAAIDQEQAYKDAVANGTMKIGGTINGVNVYLPTNAAPFQQGSVPGSNPGQTTLGVPSPYQQQMAQTAQKQLSFNPTSDLTPGMSGDNVKQLQNYLISQGYKISDGATGYYGDQTKAAVAAWQQASGINAGNNAGYFGPLSRQYLASNPATASQSMGVTDSTLTNGGVPGYNPYGTLSGQGMNLLSGDQSTYPQGNGLGLSTQDVMNQQNSYENIINGYLKQQADAYSALQNTKATALQGQANIMYGLNGTGGHDANLQGAEQQQFDRQMAFQTTPAEIALGNAQNALALFKQSPTYLNETQARDTAYNLLQNYPDINYQYNPQLSAQQNLQAIKQALPSSSKYQTSLYNMSGYTDANGVFHTYYSKTPTYGLNASGATTGSGSTPVNAAITPTPANPRTAAGTYTGVGTTTLTAPDQTTPSPKTKTQVSFVENWNSGTLGTAKNSLNTAIGHLFEADQLYSSLSNGNNQLVNLGKNSLNSLFGNSAATNYQTAQSLASNELASAYGGNAVSDRAELSKFGGAQQSPAQHQGYVDTATALLSSKLGAIAEQYKSAWGTYPPSLDSLISPLNQVKLAQTKINLNGIVPGLHVSPSTQAMINTAQVVNGKVYLPGQDGKYYAQQ